MSVERVRDQVDAGAESGSDSPMLSRRPMTPGQERERKKIAGRSPASSPSFTHNDLANASPKMFHPQNSRGSARGAAAVNGPYDKSLAGTGLGREVKDIYDSSSGEEIDSDDEPLPARK